MRELIAQSLAPIRDVIQGQDYCLLKARLDQLLPKDAAQSFAKIDIKANEGIWYTENNLKFVPYSEAGDLEKEEIAIKLEEIKERAYGCLCETMPYWEKLFVIPTPDCIYWCKSEDGVMSVVITQWGFENRTIEKQADVISDIITAPRPLTQIPVVLKCNFSNGETASEYEFYLHIFNNKKLCKTDENGAYSVGSLFADKSFVVEKVDRSQRIDFTVKNDIEYVAVFNIATDYSITVLNQNDTPVPNCSLKVNGEAITTDTNGQYVVTGVILYPDSKVEVEYKGKMIGTFALSKVSEDNNFTVKIEQKIVKPQTINIRLRGYKGEPLPNMPFKVKTDKGEVIDGMTDEHGNATIPAQILTVGKKCNLSFTVTAAYQQKRKEQEQ